MKPASAHLLPQNQKSLLINPHSFPPHLRPILAVLLACLACLSAALAEPLPPKPDGYLYDPAHWLDPATADSISRQLETNERASSNQILVALIPALPENTALEDFCFRTFQFWAPGQKGKDNGAVLFIFQKDRRARIEVGYGLEPVLPDGLAGSIIREKIAPALKENDPAGAVRAGVSAIIQATRSEYKGTGQTNADNFLQRHPALTAALVGILLLMLAIWSHTGDTVYQRAGRFVFYNIFDLFRLILFALLSGASGGKFKGGGGRSGGGGASGSW